MRVTMGAALAAAVFLQAAALTGGSALAAGESPDAASAKDEIAALKAEIETLKGKLPTQAHAMIDVEYNFANLWFAGKAGNWPLAAFYLNETKNRIAWAVRVSPQRTLSTGQKLDLAPMMEAITESSIPEMGKALTAKDHKAFETAYRHAMGECYACHEAAERPFLKPHIPEAPEARVIAMDPNAPAP